MGVGKNTLEVTAEKWLCLCGRLKRIPGNRLPRRVIKREPEGM